MDVQLTAGGASGNLTIGNISPASVSNWAIGAEKTFAVTVSANDNDLGGTHAQSWSLSYLNTQKLSIGFNLSTAAPHLSLQGRYFENGAVDIPVTDGTAIEKGVSKTLKWDIRNDSEVVLNNISFTPLTGSGSLTVGSITPNTASNWAIGETRTFAVTLQAPANALSNRHSKNWQVKMAATSISLDNDQLGFSLTTDPESCSVQANPAVPSFGLVKIGNTGTALAAYSSAWACVKDKSSGLMWESKTNDGSARDKNTVYNWNNAQNLVAVANAQSLCGANDWRLPTAEELLTLVASRMNGDISFDKDFFPDTLEDVYWSESDFADGKAWGVSFKDADLQDNNDVGYELVNKTTNKYVRLVRNAN